MRYQVPPYSSTEPTAWSKAPSDVYAIARQLGFVDFQIDLRHGRSLSLFWRLIALLRWSVEMFRVTRSLHAGDVVLLQNMDKFQERCFGRKLFSRLVRKGVMFIYIVHDINGLRKAHGIEQRNLIDDFLWYARQCKKVVVHNDKMKSWCVKNGLLESRAVVLGIFDYLVPNSDLNQMQSRMCKAEIAIAGSLKTEKAAYLTYLNQVDGIRWNLFGPYYDSTKISGSNVRHMGCFHPDELPRQLQGSFGLVWDGASIDSCVGPTGDYLRYNNPHKLSLFLAAGMPVVIWREAAEADFVRENNVGIAVDSLRDLPAALSSISSERYIEMLTNAVNLSKRLRSGMYLREALGKALVTNL